MPTSLELRVRPESLAICRLGHVGALPGWVEPVEGLLCVAHDDDGLTVVCDAERVPSGVDAEHGWRALSVAGPLPLTATGVLASIATPLAEAGVPIFVVSTFDTDHCLVRDERLAEATEALAAAGHRVEA